MNDQDNAQTHNAGGRQRLWIALPALLVVLSAAAGAYGLWRVGHQQERLAAQVERLQDGIRQEESTTQALRAQQQVMQGALDSLRAEAYRGMSVRVAVEADSLVRIAHYHLSFAYDIPGAIDALAAAEQRLQEADDFRLLAVRTQITDTLRTLREVRVPDIAQLALQLKNWPERVEELPVARAAMTAPPSAPQAAHWKTLLQGLWAELKTLVSIRHRDATVVPLLPPTQQYFLYQNLRLELEMARLSLLRRDARAFHASLGTARNWIKRYFDVHAEVTTELLETLDALEQTDIAPPLPELSSLRAMLHDVIESEAGTHSNGTKLP
ncbi:MAG: uroporphyrinogen-III C-methyltransferase [Gammaproteobacteria bacterium]|nr:uroporphyrinogen-III C-methyltransferase [Gammaproteobacteria bacterium]